MKVTLKKRRYLTVFMSICLILFSFVNVSAAPEDTSSKVTAEKGTITSGKINNIVIFIKFDGDSEFNEEKSDYDKMFNSDSSNYSSVYNYFKEVSYNKLSVNTTFYPTVKTYSPTECYTDKYPRRYYMPYDSLTNLDGYTGGDTGTEKSKREQALVKKAINSVSSQIPADLDVDNNNDGYVDNISFVIKGLAGEWSSSFWPHKAVLTKEDVSINGKKVHTYNFILEQDLKADNVGAICHEMLHTVGFHDLYHYKEDKMNPVGIWDVMDMNFRTPQEPDAYSKYRYGHWIDSIPEITESGTYSLSPITSPTNNCYKIASPFSKSEYFVLEYRKKNTVFEKSLIDSGLLVYRINTLGDGKGNSKGKDDEIYLFRPEGTTTKDGNIKQANLSNNAGRTSIGGSENPLFFSDGANSLIKIENIGDALDKISFKVTIPSAKTVEVSDAAAFREALNDSNVNVINIKGDITDSQNNVFEVNTHGATINGGTINGTLKINASQVTIDGAKINTMSTSNDDKDGVIITGKKTTITNCTITGNGQKFPLKATAIQSGIVIYGNDNDNATITKNSIKDFNSSTGDNSSVGILSYNINAAINSLGNYFTNTPFFIWNCNEDKTKTKLAELSNDAKSFGNVLKTDCVNAFIYVDGAIKGDFTYGGKAFVLVCGEKGSVTINGTLYDTSNTSKGVIVKGVEGTKTEDTK